MEETVSIRINDTYKMRNYAVAIPEITAANRIITATKNLEEAILKHPTKPIDEVEAINKLRHILVLEKCNQISLPTPKARKRIYGSTARMPT